LKEISRRVKFVQWSWHEEVSEYTVSQVLLRLWDGDNSKKQERERLPLQAGTRGLVRDRRPRGLSACSELQAVRNRVRLC
jgi:hypothetical protein